MPTNDVEITVSDGSGSVVVVPSTKVQVKIGVATGGTALINQVCASTQPSQLATLHGRGPLPESAAIVQLKGGVTLTVQIPIVTMGIAKVVTRAGPNNGPALGTCGISTTLDAANGAYDDYYVVVKPTQNTTIGTSGFFQFSLDRGANFSPVVSLGTATTYTIPGTGITLNFSAGTLAIGDTYKFQTIAPQPNQAGIAAAYAALQASPYAVTGWGSMHIVGTMAGTDDTTIEGYMDTSATTYDIFSRVITDARDALAPTAWGGTGETEATWISSLQTSFNAVSAKRVATGAGHYNINSAFPVLGTTFRLRRPGSWATAARTVQTPAQRMQSRVADGQLADIVVDPINDPLDGFVYHDERITPGLTGSRFMAMRTRIGKGQGFFLDLPNLMSPVGSKYQFFPQGTVVDIGCTITFQVASDEIDDDLLLNSNGTIQEGEAKRIEGAINDQLKAQMTNVRMCSSALAVVSRTQNVQLTGIVIITVTINGVGYVLEVDATVGLQ